MLRYLLDTNIISEPAKPRPDANVQRRYDAHKHESALSSVTWQELVYGAERMPERRRRFLEQYLTGVVRPAFSIVPFDAEAAMWLGRERARLGSAGRTRPLADSMIAATAATRGLILVTRNTADFAGFDGLHVENWFDE